MNCWPGHSIPNPKLCGTSRIGWRRDRNLIRVLQCHIKSNGILSAEERTSKGKQKDGRKKGTTHGGNNKDPKSGDRAFMTR